MKKKHKKRVRVLAVDPVVSDPTVLAKLDKERQQVEEELKYGGPKRFSGYGLDDYDPMVGIATMMAMASSVSRRTRKRKAVEEQPKLDVEVVE